MVSIQERRAAPPSDQPLPSAALHLHAHVVEVHVGLAVEAVLAGVADPHVDDAALGAPVVDREVARHELDRLEEGRGEGAADPAEVVELGNLLRLEEDLAVAGGRAAQHEEPGAEGRARRAGQVEDRLQRVARPSRGP